MRPPGVSRSAHEGHAVTSSLHRLNRILAIAMCGSLLVARAASAHTEEPNAQTIFSVDDGYVLRANVGIVRSVAPDELICEEVFEGGYSWTLGVLGPEQWVTFGEGGVYRTDDGCDFEEVMPLDRRPTDGTAHAPSGGAAFVLNGDLADSGLYVSTDVGASFRRIQQFDAQTQQTTGVRYLDADTIIVSGYDRTDFGRALVWSVDVHTGAATPLTTPEGIAYPYVLDVQGGRVLLLARRGQQVVFWGTPEQLGASELVVDTWPTWAVLTDAGRGALLSGVVNARGVYVGELNEHDVATWQPFAADATANCVEPAGEDLLICGIGRIDGYDIARVTPDEQLETVLDFREFSGIRSDCPAGSDVPRICGPVWEQLAPYFGLAPFPDVGTSLPDVGQPGPADVGADVSAPAPSPDPEAGCCAVMTPTKDSSPALWLALLLVVARRRRR